VATAVRRVARTRRGAGLRRRLGERTTCATRRSSATRRLPARPLMTLGWGAAVTEHIGLGTSVLVLPLHEPIWTAKALASLDVMSGGR